MTTWFSDLIGKRRALVPLVIAALVVVGPCSAGALTALQAKPAWQLVIDRAGILDEGQERSAVNDAYRLSRYGVPTQVVTEPVGLDQLQADARADELRVSQGIESYPGASDGLLFYVSTDLYDRSNVVMSISVGARTLPRNGFNAEVLDAIRARVVAVQLAFGHPARAIVYSLREMIYLTLYVPPAVPASSGWRSDAKPIADILSPILAVAGAAWLAAGMRSMGGWRPFRSRPTAGVLMAGVLAGALVVVAVATRSPTGALASVALGGLVTSRTIALDRAPAPVASRSIQLSPRRPGSRRPARPGRASAP